MKGPKILAVTKSTGGVAFYNRLLLSELKAQDISSHTICLSDNANAYAAGLNEIGLSAEPMAMARYKIDPIGDLRVTRQILQIARTRKPDVIVCHGSKSGFVGRIVGRFTGIPVIYRQASMPFLKRVQGKKAPLYWVIDYVVSKIGGHIVTLTESAMHVTLAHKLSPRDRISVIRTGVDIEKFSPAVDRDAAVRALGLDPARPVVGWMGRLEPQKAPMDYVETIKIVAARHPDVQFVMAGDGRLRDDAIKALEAAKLTDRVTMLQWQDDPAKTLQGFDVYALSSLWEGLPITLLEAMASGCCCVSTDVDGCTDAIDDGVTGILVKSGDPALLAEALDKVLSDTELQKTYAQQSRLRATTLFDKRTMVANWIALMNKLVKGKAAGAVTSSAVPADRIGSGK